MELTHIDKSGCINMVDVGEKAITERTAQAQACLKMKPETLQCILENGGKKGNVIATARIAGIMAAKNTSNLIPLCHPLPLTKIAIDIEPEGEDKLCLRSLVKCSYQTGVEMEALTAVSVAALTVYDMCKAIDRGMRIDEVYLLKKDGGRSGLYSREQQAIVQSLHLKPVKSKALLSLECMHVDENGIEGFTEGERAVSLMDAQVADDMEAANWRGLCMKKFYANIVTKNLNYASLQRGTLLKIGSVCIEITEVGKPCFSGCDILKDGNTCSLKTGCAFGKVRTKGNISLEDMVERLGVQ